MNELYFEYEKPSWEVTLDMLHPGDSISAVRLLTLLEGEEEAQWEDALQTLEDRHIALTVAELPKDYGSADEEQRLRREEMLAADGQLLKSLEKNDPLWLYLNELAQIPSAGDPQILAQQCLEGQECARQLLVNVTISRAVSAAQKMTGHGVLLLDLIQEASLGLWEAILRYEGGDFESHADWWIAQHLAKVVTMQARENGIGRKLKNALEDYRAADKRLLTELGRNPIVEEVALELHISPEEAEVYQEMLRTARIVEKAKRPAIEQEPEDNLAIENTAYFQSRQRIMDMLSTLTEQEARVLTLRFGLEGEQPYTPEETATRLNVTADRVIQIETAALTKLRNQ